MIGDSIVNMGGGLGPDELVDNLELEDGTNLLLQTGFFLKLAESA